jgi:ABC-2 type transport system ATP-binding protein
VTALISLESVTKRYTDADIIDVQTLALPDGSRIAFVGQNGSGKSTLLRVLTGVTRPSTGRRMVHESMAASPPGYVPQSGGIYPDLTVRSNLHLRRRLRGAGTDRLDVVARLGLTGLLDRPAGQLSVGYRRLVAAACALVGEPEWVVMDEPFAGVDEENRKRLADLLRDLPLRLLVLADVAAPPPGLVDRQMAIEQGRLA